MASFCKYCGKPLTDGLCDCPAALAAQVPNTPTPSIEPIQVQFQETAPPPAQPVQTSILSQDSKTHLIDAKNIAISMIKHPATTLEQVRTEKKNAPGIILMVIHLLIMWLCTSVNVPLIGTFIKTGGRIKAGFFLLLIAGIMIVILSFISMLLGKKANSELSFVDFLAVFGSATVPGTLLFLGAFIFGFFAISISALLFFACYLSWLYMSLEAINMLVKEKRNSNFWIVLLIQILCILLIVLIFKGMITSTIQNQIGSSLGSLTDLL